MPSTKVVFSNQNPQHVSLPSSESPCSEKNPKLDLQVKRKIVTPRFTREGTKNPGESSTQVQKKFNLDIMTPEESRRQVLKTDYYPIQINEKRVPEVVHRQYK